jgi:hypothetical protein
MLLLARAQLQAAADAAALAAAREAVPVVELTVRSHVRECRWVERWTGYGSDRRLERVLECVSRDARSETVRGPATDLLTRGNWWRAAGCDALSDPSGREGQWKVCESWRQAGIAEWTFAPVGSAPRAAAADFLQRNLAPLAANWELTGFSVEEGTGTVRLSVRATLRYSPLAVVTARPTTIAVEAWAKPTAR